MAEPTPSSFHNHVLLLNMHLEDVPMCPIDGSPGPVRLAHVRDAYFETPGEWTYRQSPRTGHLWLDPRPAGASISALYANYYTHSDQSTGEVHGLWQQAKALALSARLGYPLPEETRFISKFVSFMPTVGASAELDVMRIPASETGRLLDVGCGEGAYLRRMRKAGWSVTGIEPDSLAAARLSGQEGFVVYSSLEEAIRDLDHSFDVIVLSHVIEHLADPIDTLSQLRNLLSQGGRLLLATPNARSLGSRVFGKDWRGLEPPRHFNVFTPESLRQAMGHAGYRIERMHTEVRLARGIWFLSQLAREGRSGLEDSRVHGRPLLRLAGFLFQLLEAGAVGLRLSLGEEIFCSATAEGAGAGAGDDCTAGQGASA